MKSIMVTVESVEGNGFVVVGSVNDRRMIQISSGRGGRVDSSTCLSVHLEEAELQLRCYSLALEMFYQEREERSQDVRRTQVNEFTE